MKKRLLHIIPYQHLFPPQNGGALRCFHITQELAKYFDLDILSYQTDLDKNSISGQVSYYTPKDFPSQKSLLQKVPKIGNGLYYRWLRKSWQGPAESVLLDFAEPIRALLKQQHYDYVLFEHLSSMMGAPLVRKVSPSTQCILDAHNVDHLLASKSKDRQRIKRIESKLFEEVDFFFTCSDLDKQHLENLNQGKITGYTIPNGVNVEAKLFHPEFSKKERLIFCGSLDYVPNKEGLLWFLNKVWPTLQKANPSIHLDIVGRGKAAYLEPYLNQQNLNLMGEVNTVNSFYQTANIAIVPLLSGSGTRLKVLEAMSFGNPIVSTAKGAEGIDYRNEENILIADSAETFSSAILSLIAEPQRAEKQAKNARQLVEAQYSWEVIGRKIKNTLQ